MNKYLYGALFGLLSGGLAIVLAYTVLKTVIADGSWTIYLWMAGFVVWGVILGVLLPKPKA